MPIKIIRSLASAHKEIDRLASRGDFLNKKNESIVKTIITDVRRNGDRAVKKYSKKFDSVTQKNLRVPPKEIDRAYRSLSRAHRMLFQRVIKNVRAFHKIERKKSWMKKMGHCRLGERITAVSSVGIYIPGGLAPLVSSVFMTVIPAQAAGVKKIIVTSPPAYKGRVNPIILAALKMLGIRDVFSVGGAQAIAAMAFGTQTIPRVDKIVGPGNRWVTLAKKAVYGIVDIDMLAGPSEIVIVSGSKGLADFIASDLLAQAEHDPMASSILITNSKRLAMNVKTEIQTQLNNLCRTKSIAKKSLVQWGRIMMVEHWSAAVDLVNRISPEHLLLIHCPRAVLSKIKNAGAIFVGPYSPVVLGDYVTGPSHVLPTHQSARFASGLSVSTFLKKSSFISYSKKNPQALKDAASMAELEGLEAHVRSSKIRL